MKPRIYECVFQYISLSVVFLTYFVETEASAKSPFSSLSQVMLLWHNEIRNIKIMEHIIEKMNNPSKELKIYVKSHYRHCLNQTPNYDYLGHPLNAYHLIRHIASGWNIINNSGLNNEVMHGGTWYLKKLRSLYTEMLPDIDDVIGGAVSIVKLWNIYRIDLKELVRNGKIVSKLENGKQIKSKSSSLKINAFDLEKMVAGATSQNLYYAAAVFARLLARQVKKEEKLNNLNYEYMWKFKMTLKKAKLILSKAEKLHDSKLKKLGQFSISHECNSIPFNTRLKIKKKNMPHADFTDRKFVTFYHSMTDEKRSPQLMDVHFSSRTNNAKTLCRRGQILHAIRRDNLRCYNSYSNSDWLRLGPLKFEVNSYDPFHVTIKQLFFPHECDDITSNNTQHLTPYDNKKSKVHEKVPWTDLRIMQNFRIQENTSVTYDKVNRRIEHFTNLKSNTTKDEAEGLFLGDYGIGGSYWPHVDYSGTDKKSTGERLATIVTILDAPKAGGATVFPYAGISVFPEKGDGIFWHNIYKTGTLDSFTTHLGCPVLLGNKIIGTKWIGFDSQWNTISCDLTEFSRFGWKDP